MIKDTRSRAFWTSGWMAGMAVLRLRVARLRWITLPLCDLVKQTKRGAVQPVRPASPTSSTHRWAAPPFSPSTLAFPNRTLFAPSSATGLEPSRARASWPMESCSSPPLTEVLRSSSTTSRFMHQPERRRRCGHGAPVVGYGHYVRHGVENPALYRLITWVGPSVACEIECLWRVVRQPPRLGQFSTQSRHIECERRAAAQVGAPHWRVR